LHGTESCKPSQRIETRGKKTITFHNSLHQFISGSYPYSKHIYLSFFSRSVV
jgi:hypothetical protein